MKKRRGQKIKIFRQAELAPGDRIHITDGPRRGDWEVAAASEKNLTLRCPVSGREFTWTRFCYLLEEREQPWPLKEH